MISFKSLQYIHMIHGKAYLYKLFPGAGPTSVTFPFVPGEIFLNEPHLINIIMSELYG